MLLAPSLEAVEATLLAAGLPVAAPLPGPVLHTDLANATLTLRVPTRLGAADSAGLAALASAVGVALDAPSALSLALLDATLRPLPPGPHAPAGRVAHLRYAMRPGVALEDGRVRVRLTMPAALLHAGRTSPLRLAVHLFVRRMGEHGATRAWLPAGVADPWHRDGAFFGWDARKGRVTEERRVYMSGLSDEAGAAAGVAMAVKQVGMGVRDEVAKLEEYVAETLFQGDHPDRTRFVQGADDQMTA
jgi:hypothetical protein